MQKQIQLKVLTELHSHRGQMLDRDKDLLLGDNDKSDTEAIQEFMETSTVHQITNWIHLHKQLSKLSIEEARAFSIRNVRPLTTYFQRTVATPLIKNVRQRRQKLKKPPDIGLADLRQRSVSFLQNCPTLKVNLNTLHHLNNNNTNTKRFPSA